MKGMMNKKIVYRLILFSAILLMFVMPYACSCAEIEVNFLDVGQGDAALIICDGKTMIIDGGKSDNSRFIYSYLNQRQIHHIDYMVASHPDSDHIGGLSAVFNIADVDNVIISSFGGNNKAFTSLSKYIRKSQANIQYAAVGSTFRLGGAKVEVLCPIYPSSNINDTSVVLKITYKKVVFLFTGDMENQEETDLLASGKDIDCTVLKVAHHGGSTSSGEEFLKAASPEHCVISVGAGNDYGHPNDDTIARLSNVCNNILRTDQCGTITFTSDGRNIEIKTEHTYSPKVAPEATKKVEAASPPPSANSINYVLNTNTMKFHYPECNSAKSIKAKNRKEVAATREELIEQGYSPCGNCKP